MAEERIQYKDISDSCDNLTSTAISLQTTIGNLEDAIKDIKEPTWAVEAAESFVEKISDLEKHLPEANRQLAEAVLFLASCADGYKSIDNSSVEKLKDVIGGQDYIDKYDVASAPDIDLNSRVTQDDLDGKSKTDDKSTVKTSNSSSGGGTKSSGGGGYSGDSSSGGQSQLRKEDKKSKKKEESEDKEKDAEKAKLDPLKEVEDKSKEEQKEEDKAEDKEEPKEDDKAKTEDATPQEETPKEEQKEEPKVEPKPEATAPSKTETTYYSGGGYSKGEYTESYNAPTTESQEPSKLDGVEDPTEGLEDLVEDAETSIDDIIKESENEVTKIPSSEGPISNSPSGSSGNGVIPIVAGISVAAAAGIGAKAYLDKKRNDDKNENEEYDSEEWSNDDYDDKIDYDEYDDTYDEPAVQEKYEARKTSELADTM